MSGDEQITYFVARGATGEVTHLVRTIHTPTQLRAEYYRAGSWHDDPAAFSIADDGSASTMISADEASQLIAADAQTALHAGFASYFQGRGPALPSPIPTQGATSGNGWSVRFVLRELDGRPALELIAERGMQPPLRGRILADGTAVTLESYLDTWSVDPSRGETDDDGRRRMHEHNERVTAELRAVGLLPLGIAEPEEPDD